MSDHAVFVSVGITRSNGQKIVLHNRHEAADRGSATSRQILRVERTCHGRRGTAEFDPIADSCVTRRDHRCSQSCMDRSRASSVGVILRCLAPVEHAVVAHDADVAKPRALWEIDSIFEGLCICLRAPGHEKAASRMDRLSAYWAGRGCTSLKPIGAKDAGACFRERDRT